jgi:hypothetical protein
MQRRVFCGDDMVSVSLPEETRSIFPPEPGPGLRDYEGAVRRALSEPLGSPPLASLVRSGSRITIAFDDPCLPQPPMARDVRGRAIEVVLQELYRAGVAKERIRLVCAVGLHRKWTQNELRALLGRRIWREMGPERISNHDAEDPDGIVELGRTPGGHPVQVNRAVAESDLLVYVNVNWTPMNGGWKSIVVGLGAFESIRTHHNAKVLEQGTLMDPSRSLYHGMMSELGSLVSGRARVFTIETVVNNRVWGPGLDRFLSVDGKGRAERLSPLMNWAGRLPDRLKQALSASLRSAYEPVAVHAGRVDDVHPATLAALARQQNVTVTGQTDALFLALPNLSPYSVFSRINPILAANMALGYVYNLHQRRPVVRDGGVLILMNPFVPGFHPRHHPSYRELYDRVLSQTRDPGEIEARFMDDFAARPEYIDRYRRDHAYHGVHPIFVWSWGCMALKRLAEVLVVGARDPSVAERLGFRPVPSLERALAIAQERLGKGFSMTHIAVPPIFVTEVL